MKNDLTARTDGTLDKVRHLRNLVGQTHFLFVEIDTIEVGKLSAQDLNGRVVVVGMVEQTDKCVDLAATQLHLVGNVGIEW